MQLDDDLSVPTAVRWTEGHTRSAAGCESDKVTPVERGAVWTVWIASIFAALAGVLLVLRAILGPFAIAGIRIRSPLTLETSFAVLAGILLLLACRPGEHHGAIPPKANWPLLLLALVWIAVAFSPNLPDPFVSDDYILVSRYTLDAGRIARDFITPGGDGALRPVGDIGYAVVHTLAGLRPFPWHCYLLGVHLLNCALLYGLVRMLWRNVFVSFTAASLFGLHGSRPQSVTWASDNFDLLACVLSLMALWYLFRPLSRRRWVAVTPALVLLAAAIFCKESAYVVPVLAFTFALAAGRLGDRAVRLFLPWSVLVCVALFAYRWVLFGGPGGYLDPVSGRPAILSLHFLSTAKAFCLRMWAILLFPVNWREPTGIGIAVALAAGCGAILFLLWSSSGLPARLVIALVGATICAMVPVLHLALVDESVIGSRIFYIPALPFCVLAGHLVASVRSRRRIALILAALLLSTTITLEHNLRFWHRAALAADQICDAIASGRPVPTQSHDLPGLLSFGNGLQECAEQKREQRAGH